MDYLASVDVGGLAPRYHLWVSITLKSLIDEETGINEQGATLLAYLLSKLINEQGGIFRLLHEKLQTGWKENLKNLSKQAFLLGTSEYPIVL